MNNIVIVGLDVHKDSISACILDPASGEVCLEQRLKNQPSAIDKLMHRIRERYGEARCCYEASSCGFVLFRLLHKMGIHCDVIAPSSIPRRSGDRVKNDRIDAQKLATLYAAGLLTPVEIPDEQQEAARSLLRCRAALVDELTRAKHRTTQFLQSRGFTFTGGTNWSQKFWLWLAKVELCEVDQAVLDTYVHLIHYLEAQVGALEERIERLAKEEPYRAPVQVLSAFRGIATITALTLACELGDIRRFAHPRQLMAYLGLVPSEHSSGAKTERGSITKAGNTHARKAIVSAAWKYAARPARGHALKQRQRQASPRVIATTWKAQQRLYKRFHALAFRKERSVAAVAVARELSGFLWEAMQTLRPAETSTVAL